MKNITIFMLNVIFFLGCKELEPRRPINKQKQFFLKESAIRNKNTLSVEQTLFRKIIILLNMEIVLISNPILNILA